jgi:hypothetical protein
MKKTRPLKDRATVRLVRLLVTAALAIVLVIVLVRMILPDGEHRGSVPSSDADKTLTPGYTAYKETDKSADDSAAAPGDIETALRTYSGEGAEPPDNPKLTWRMTLEMSGRELRLLDGRVAVVDFAGDPPVTDLSFMIDPGHYRINLIESEKVAVNVNSPYDRASASLFSINDSNQFFIYLTPKKLAMPDKAVPTRFLSKRENTPLIELQGFIRTDNKIIGTFHCAFGPDFEYILEPTTAE